MSRRVLEKVAYSIEGINMDLGHHFNSIENSLGHVPCSICLCIFHTGPVFFACISNPLQLGAPSRLCDGMPLHDSILDLHIQFTVFILLFGCVHFYFVFEMWQFLCLFLSYNFYGLLPKAVFQIQIHAEIVKPLRRQNVNRIGIYFVLLTFHS